MNGLPEYRIEELSENARGLFVQITERMDEDIARILMHLEEIGQDLGDLLVPVRVQSENPERRMFGVMTANEFKAQHQNLFQGPPEENTEE